MTDDTIKLEFTEYVQVFSTDRSFEGIIPTQDTDTVMEALKASMLPNGQQRYLGKYAWVNGEWMEAEFESPGFP